jgi:hypothetical protein
MWFLQTPGKCPDYQAHLPDETAEIALEPDEMWTFVDKFWLWIAFFAFHSSNSFDSLD